MPQVLQCSGFLSQYECPGFSNSKAFFSQNCCFSPAFIRLFLKLKAKNWQIFPFFCYNNLSLRPWIPESYVLASVGNRLRGKEELLDMSNISSNISMLFLLTNRITVKEKFKDVCVCIYMILSHRGCGYKILLNQILFSFKDWMEEFF